MPEHLATSVEIATVALRITHADGTIEELGEVYNSQVPPTPVPGVLGAYYQVVDLVYQAVARLYPGTRQVDGEIRAALAGGTMWVALVRRGPRTKAYLTRHPRSVGPRIALAAVHRLRATGQLIAQPGWAVEYYRSGENVTYYCLA